MGNLGRQHKFSAYIVVTTLRQDSIVLSEVTKQLTLIELPVHLEVCSEEAFERKNATYKGVVKEC